MQIRTTRNILRTGALLMALSIILGAFGAHTLKAHLTDYQLGIFKTGVHYHMIHGLGMILLAFMSDVLSFKQQRIVSWMFIGGIICFSGSLYLLACRVLFGIESWWILGPMTPFGGLLFILGWLLIAYFSLKKR